MLSRLKAESIWVCMLIAILLLTMIVPVINPSLVSASDTRTLTEAMDEIVSYYENHKTSLDNWEEIIALSDAGVDLSDDPWQLPDLGVGSLDSESPALKYSSTILAMEALGQDPSDIDGRNLLAELSNMQTESGAFPGSINNTIWSIIALDKTEGDYRVDKAIDYLIAQQSSDGGFALSGSKADPDITGLALLALSTHIDIPGVTDTIDQIKDCLKEIQLDSGGFSSGEAENTESIASVIRGLTAIGEDITSAGWIKNEKTMIDALFAQQLGDYSFSHTPGGPKDDMATRQALIAVSALVKANINYSIGPNGGTGGSNDEQGVRVRVEGAAGSLHDSEVMVTGTALDALQAAVGADNVVLDDYGLIDQILGESGVVSIVDGINTSWLYYVIRNGNIEDGAFSTGPGSYNIEAGDEVVFYIGAYDAVSWEGKTYFPLVSVNPASPTAGQTVTINIKAQKYDWTSGLQDLSPDEINAIGEYTVKVGEQEYTSTFGQVIISDLPEGVLQYSVLNSNDAGYVDVVSYKDSIEVGASVYSSVRVRVEGAVDSLHDSEVTVAGTALDALRAAVGADNLVAPGGFISQILGESGVANIAEELNTSWHYYVIRNGNIETGAFSTGAGSYNIEAGDEVVFYIGAYDTVSWEGKTYFPLVSIYPAAPTAGQTITINIKAQKYDWMLGLQDLNEQETETIAEYLLSINGQEYTSNDGKISIPSLSVGVYEYSIVNSNDTGYPDVVTYKGTMNVIKSGDPGSGSTDKSIRVYIAVVGSDGELLFSPQAVKVHPDDTYGLTAVGALDATGLSWDYTPGLVTEIEGQQNQGMNGWMCKINNKGLNKSAFESSVKENDQVIWWYSYDPNSDGPNWKEISSGTSASSGSLQLQLSRDLGGYSQQLDELKDSITIINADKRMSSQQVKQLQKELGNNQVSLQEEAKVGQDTQISDKLGEISVFIPAGALSQPIKISVQESNENQPRTQFGIRLAGSVYEFGPDGSSFDVPLTIGIKIAITDDLDIQRLSPAWYDSEKEQWIPIPALLDLENGLVVFKIDHFTSFTLAEFPVRRSFDDLGRAWEWAREAIEVLAGQGIIHGTGKGFEPARPISRAEFVQLLVNALHLSLPSDAVEQEFKDIQAGDWYAPAISTACANKIVSGYPDASFKPHKAISRNEIACILHRLQGGGLTAGELDYVDKDAIPVWAQPSVCFTAQVQLLKGYEDGSFRGHNSLTRAEAAVIVYRYLNYLGTV